MMHEWQTVTRSDTGDTIEMSCVVSRWPGANWRAEITQDRGSKWTSAKIHKGEEQVLICSIKGSWTLMQEICELVLPATKARSMP